jgi:hypothetical protein
MNARSHIRLAGKASGWICMVKRPELWSIQARSGCHTFAASSPLMTNDIDGPSELSPRTLTCSPQDSLLRCSR